MGWGHPRPTQSRRARIWCPCGGFFRGVGCRACTIVSAPRASRATTLLNYSTLLLYYHTTTILHYYTRTPCESRALSGRTCRRCLAGWRTPHREGVAGPWTPETKGGAWGRRLGLCGECVPGRWEIVGDCRRYVGDCESPERLRVPIFLSSRWSRPMGS